MRRGWIGVVVSCSLALAVEAFAQAPRMRLDYQRAPGLEAVCPDEETFRQMVGVFAKGEDPFKPGAADVVRVTLDRRGTSYHATIALVSPDGSQHGTPEEHTLRTCPEAAREAASTAYLVAVPFTFPQAQKPAPLPTVARPAATAPPQPVPAPPPPARHIFVQLGAGAAAVAGFSPNPSAGFGGLVGLRFVGSPSWSLSAEARADIDTAGAVLPLADGGSAQPRAGFAGGSLAPCVHVPWFFACALATIGHVRTAAGDETAPRDGEALYFGVGGRAGAEIPLWTRPAHLTSPRALPGVPVLVLQIAADGLFTLVRPGIRVDGAEVWEAPLAAGLLGARLVTIF